MLRVRGKHRVRAMKKSRAQGFTLQGFTLQGFTLIELMVAIAVLGVLIGIAYPSFTEMMRNNRIETQANELFTAFNVARSEAAKRGVNVSVCSTASSTSCGGPADWSSGWMIFTDATGAVGTCDSCDPNGDPAAVDVPLQYWSAPTGGVHLDTAGAPPGVVTFRADGTLNAAAATAFKMTQATCTGSHARQVTIQQNGSMRSQAASCP